MSETVLTGIKPTGTPHLGNLVGAIEPALALAREPGTRPVYFVADAHALNALRDRERMRAYTREVAAAYLAFGLDSQRVLFFRQSDVPEIFELAALLACVCPKGLVNRAHAYKAAVAANTERGKDPDAGVNMGLFTYPILMAADILAFDANVVPVGADQRQHVEIAREIAQRANRELDAVVTVPEARVRRDAASIPGTDGRKMSKSYGNAIPLFAPADALRARVAAVKTDARRPGVAGDAAGAPLFEIARAVASPAQTTELREAFAQGASYAAIKQRVFEIIEARLAEPRRAYARLISEPDRIDDILDAGIAPARAIAAGVLARVKGATGLGRPSAIAAPPRRG